MYLSSDTRDLHTAALGGTGEDGMFSLIWAKDLITAAKAACLSFQPGAAPAQGVVLPLWWPGSRTPSNPAVRRLGYATGR